MSKIGFATAIAAMVPSMAFAGIARFAAVQGSVVVERGTAKRAATVGGELALGDVVQTQRASRAKILFNDGSVLNVGDNSRVKMSKYLFEAGRKRHGVVELVRGVVRAWVTKLRKPGSRFEVRTPTAVAGVRGTDYAVREKTDGAQVVVFSGRVTVSSPSPEIPGRCVARGGMFCELTPGKSVAPARTAPPRILQDFRNVTKVAARISRESVRLAQLVGPGLHRAFDFRMRLRRRTARREIGLEDGSERTWGGRERRRLPGDAAGLRDTIFSSRTIDLRILGRVRPNY